MPVLLGILRNTTNGDFMTYNPISLEDYIATLPATEQAAIAKRTEELVAEELTLQALRKARKLTQKTLAKKLKVDQVAISQLERRSDMLLSTLQNHLAAMGGKLQLVVEFPNRPAVALVGLGKGKDVGRKI
jgi:DNA-binding XRE family transcriptional regulator